MLKYVTSVVVTKKRQRLYILFQKLFDYKLFCSDKLTWASVRMKPILFNTHPQITAMFTCARFITHQPSPF